nr:beta-D-glucosyl crocetin beta-1,6-glucosyltransferase-like [Tanacetum cinerariifolium]
MKYGVPIIAMPMHLDQPINARLVVDVRVGVEVVRVAKGLRWRDNVAKVVKLGAVELWRIDRSWVGGCSGLGLGIESHGGRRDSPKKCMVLRVGQVCVVSEGEDSTDNQKYGSWSSQRTRAGHDGLVGKIGPDDGRVHKQWVEMGLFGVVVAKKLNLDMRAKGDEEIDEVAKELLQLCKSGSSRRGRGYVLHKTKSEGFPIDDLSEFIHAEEEKQEESIIDRLMDLPINKMLKI